MVTRLRSVGERKAVEGRGYRYKATHARVSILEGSPAPMDQSLSQVREEGLPRAKQIDGFEGTITLGDRRRGRALGITFWEIQEAMRTSEEASNELREESAEAGDDTIAGA